MEQDKRIPFAQKWELHKPLLKRLYLDENFKLPKIKDIMRTEHDFDAEVHQYKYQIKKWDWGKSIPKLKKTQILDALQRKSKHTQSDVVAVTYKGRALDPRKLLRHAKYEQGILVGIPSQVNVESSRAFMASPLLGSRMTMINWNLPFEALMRQLPSRKSPRSPQKTAMTPMSDIEIGTPPSSSSPCSFALSDAVALKAASLNASLFIHGNFDKLVSHLDSTQKKVLSTWISDFRHFSFITAKHWGSHGPKDGTTSEVIVGTLYAHASGSHDGTLLDTRSPVADSVYGGQRPRDEISPPTQLCRYNVHVGQDDPDFYNTDRDVVYVAMDYNHRLDEEWLEPPPLEQTIQEGLQDNCFTTIDASGLPVDINLVLQAVRKSPEEIFNQSLAFAIMASNVDLVANMMVEVEVDEKDISNIQPLHLATTYLNGSKSCCQILQILSSANVHKWEALSPIGYTVFDNLMVAILRNHSEIMSQTVDENLKGLHRFDGEEVDICGRWDSESHQHRVLVEKGMPVPFDWKHKFCHTSIQVVCHSIKRIDQRNLVVPSGLFLRRCFSCGTKLELTSLHTLIMTAFHLSRSGTNDEDLFGMICVLLAFATSVDVFSVQNPFKGWANISIQLLRGDDPAGGDFCNHEELSPAQFAHRLSLLIQNESHTNATCGWLVFCRILQQIENEYHWARSRIPPPDYQQWDSAIPWDLHTSDHHFIWISRKEMKDHTGFALECSHEYMLEFSKHPRCFGRNLLLGHIWAACQCELLTYRRGEEGKSWLSERLSIDMLQDALSCGSAATLPAIAANLLKEYCACGHFEGETWSCPDRRKACTSNFSNLDVWNRSTYLEGIEDELE